jgi:type 1 glutamine amidotransferase
MSLMRQSTRAIITRRDFLRRTCATAGVLAAPGLGHALAAAQTGADSEEGKRIEAALPARAFVKPRKPRKLLIFDLNVGYGGHGSIRTANLAFTMMGAKTGAFETVISRDPAVFGPESLRQFDAVFFNNTVGNCFEDPALRQSLLEFVYGGGGLMGVHGTSVAFTKWPGAIEDWPEFGIMLGARGANHKANDEHVFIKLDDPTHPVNHAFGGQDFDYRDEFFRVHGPYSRDRVRVLMSIDTAKTDMQQTPSYGQLERADNDYALAWVRQYGRGRIFYCGFAHHPSVFWDPKMLQFYLAATQFALGDLPAPTTPSAKLTPAIRAQEQLGWRLGLVPPAAGELSLFETVDRAAELGLLYVGACNRQTVSGAIAKSVDEQLNDDEMRQIRLKLDSAGVRLLTYHVEGVPSDEAGCRRIFQFARKMGVEAVTVGPAPEPPDTVKKLCEECGISYAVPADHMPCDRPAIVRIPAGTETARDEKITSLLKETRDLGLRPVLFAIEASSGAKPAVTRRSIDSFNSVSVQLAK